MEVSPASRCGVARKGRFARIHITNDTTTRTRTFIAPPVRRICRVMSGRRLLQVHRESNNYVFPLLSCLCVWSKHNVMAKRAAANHRAHPDAGIFSNQSALTRRRSGRSVAVRKGACVRLTDASCYVHSCALFDWINCFFLLIFTQLCLITRAVRRSAAPQFNQLIHLFVFYIKKIFSFVDLDPIARKKCWRIIYFSTFNFSQRR